MCFSKGPHAKNPVSAPSMFVEASTAGQTPGLRDSKISVKLLYIILDILPYLSTHAVVYWCTYHSFHYRCSYDVVTDPLQLAFAAHLSPGCQTSRDPGSCCTDAYEFPGCPVGPDSPFPGVHCPLNVPVGVRGSHSLCC